MKDKDLRINLILIITALIWAWVLIGQIDAH